MNKKVVKAALVSRLISLATQCVFNNLVLDYDSSEEHCSLADNSLCQSCTNITRTPNSLSNQVLVFSLGGNAKWDAVYFTDIARNGYLYEQNMAFFPLFPLLVYCAGVILNPLQFLLNLTDKILLILAATGVNMAAFALAALGLFHFTQKIFNSQKHAYKAVLFFCFNPASVFFTAGYSESIFAMAQFWGMNFLEENNLLGAAFLFSLGTGTRSNGIVSTGFIIYKTLRILYGRYKLVVGRCHFAIMLLLNIIKMLFLASVIVFPFIAFQYYGYMLFCRSAEGSPWCNQFLPFPYSYIQKHYWNVGFLRYFQLKQLPNFLLATPAFVMGMWGIWEYISQQTVGEILSLGFLIPSGHQRDCFVYIVHLGFLLVFGVTSMHIQVLTRFILSSSPMLYWFAATWSLHENMKSKLVFTYFLVYFWLGFLLHCNFYPWT